MLESGSSGSVRGVPSNGHPYRDPRSNPSSCGPCSSPSGSVDAKALAFFGIRSQPPLRLDAKNRSQLIGDQRFESCPLRRRVRLTGAFHGYRRKGPAFAGV